VFSESFKSDIIRDIEKVCCKTCRVPGLDTSSHGLKALLFTSIWLPIYI
jgi:hypothetical protein